MKLGVVITSYNRPEYLQECLDSILHADIPVGTTFYVIDDASTDEKTKEILSGLVPTYFFNPTIKTERNGICDSLLIGYEKAFNDNCDVVMNLDNDAIVRNDAFNKILELQYFYPERIITGFHSTTKNANGTERHIILNEFPYAYEKQSVGGINLCMNKEVYEKYLKPTLEHCLQYVGNFDHQVSLKCLADGKPVISVKESVVQHIGFVSSMGHTGGIEQPDTADTFKNLHLPDVTLVCADCVDLKGALSATTKSIKNIKFGAVKLFTHLNVNGGNDFEVINIPQLKSKEDYSRFIFEKIVDYINTDYFLVIQADGYVVNWKAWNDEFLEYDYIGALWTWYQDGMKCGNGGFSLRSKRLHEIIKNDPKILLANDNIISNYAEDHNICRIYREYLEKEYSIKFAPDDVCEVFSIEAWKRNDNKYKGSFGFHGNGIYFGDFKI